MGEIGLVVWRSGQKCGQKERNSRNWTIYPEDPFVELWFLIDFNQFLGFLSAFESKQK